MNPTKKEKFKFAYADWEKRMSKMDWNPDAVESYWAIRGEAEITYGEVTLYESRETLKNSGGRIFLKERPKYLNRVLDNGTKRKILRKFPKKCGDCGFHRFFGIRVQETSIGQYITIACPNCKKELVEMDLTQ